MLEAEGVRADREHRRAEHELAARLRVESELAASEETVERLQLSPLVRCHPRRAQRCGLRTALSLNPLQEMDEKSRWRTIRPTGFLGEIP